jgi:hypothetical protein
MMATAGGSPQGLYRKSNFPSQIGFRLKAFYGSRVKFSRFTLSFLGLAFCVFIWGLQYKLSLYDPPQSASHKIPTAKLLSKNEQRKTSETTLVRQSGLSKGDLQLALICLALPFLAAINLFYRPVLVRRDADVNQPWRLCRRASLNAFSFRPPPIPA